MTTPATQWSLAADIADGRTLYINRGLGYTFRVRVHVRPELTLFTLAGG